MAPPLQPVPLPLPPASACWAKWESATGRWHPLWAHSLDVAAVLVCLLGPGGVLRRPLRGHLSVSTLGPGGSLPQGLLEHLTYLAILHDAGKTNCAFQAQLRLGATAPNRGHVRPFLDAWGQPGVRAWVGRALSGMGEDVRAADVLRETVCHHGRPFPPGQHGSTLAGVWIQPPGSAYHPGRALDHLLRLASEVTGLRPAPLGVPPASPVTFSLRTLSAGASQHLAGALTLADWIGSNAEYFPLIGPPGTDPPDAVRESSYWTTALARAREVCADMRLCNPPRPAPSPSPAASDTPDEPGPGLLERLFPSIFGSALGPAGETGGRGSAPTPVQQHLAERPLGPGLYILESETGSGKTEAALTLYARLREAGLVDGLVFALPTRATTLAMRHRVERFLSHLHGAAAPPVVLAVGGRQHDSGQGAFARDPSPSPVEGVLPDDEPALFGAEDDEARAAARQRWASASSKRYLTGEVVVGTIDQVLLAGLAVSHAHLRLAALSRHLIVVDEVHAYDRYMTETLANLLRHHVRGAGSALLMSATLASSARQDYDLVERWRDPADEATAERQRQEAGRPYPALWHQPRAECPMTAVGLTHGVSQGSSLRWDTTTETCGLQEAVRAARAGARVLVLRNTVRGARATMDLLSSSGAGDLLWRPATSRAGTAYHSRYSTPDRQLLDHSVLTAFGRGTPNQGVILVATQVVEQSLDVDFDLAVTDLAPVDLLLQRAGRLQRHPERVRPAVIADRRLLVIGPADSEGFSSWLGRNGRPVVRQRGLGWGTVYGDLADLELTRRLLQSDPHVVIPADNRRLVEAVYHPARRALLRPTGAWGPYLDSLEGRDAAQRQNSTRMRLNFGVPYGALAAQYAAVGEREVRTRLGDDRIEIRLGTPVPSYHGQGPSSVLALPFGVLSSAGVVPPDEIPAAQIAVGPEETKVAVSAGCVLRYDHAGWHW